MEKQQIYNLRVKGVLSKGRARLIKLVIIIFIPNSSEILRYYFLNFNNLRI